MRRFIAIITVCLIWLLLANGTVSCFAQEFEQVHHSKRFWIFSVAVLVAANILDVASSRGRYESNPLMSSNNGTFNSGRAAAVKGITLGGMLAAETVLTRRAPHSAKAAAFANLLSASAFTGIAIHNWRIPKAGARTGTPAQNLISSPQAATWAPK